jgi:hypothetical protein
MSENVPPPAGAAKDWEARDEPVSLPLNQVRWRQTLTEGLDEIEISDRRA